MPEYPKAIAMVDRMEPVPRRIRAYLAGKQVLDTTRARYVWEWPLYPQYYIPVADLDRSLLIDEQRTEESRRGTARVHGLRVGETVRRSCGRCTRRVRVELEGVVLAESTSPVLAFETGLPTRYYLNRTDVNLSHLVPSATATACPYKGRTSDYWSVRVGGTVHPDLAWSYGFPTAALLPIAGLITFYNEKVDLTVDGERLNRPKTHFS